ncbi:MAG: 30S ribosomal protein S17 [Candidatus Microgenomates bacterium]
MKIFTGIVTARKMDKTATVEVARIVVHPLYRKRFKVTRKYHVHDTTDAKVGDNVKFAASKPFSKMVKWQVVTKKTK